MGKVTSIDGEARWAGEPLEQDEIDDIVSYFEEVLKEAKAGRIRGFSLAYVSESGPASTYRVTVKSKTGCNRLNLIGAAHLAAYETAALSSEVVENKHVEEE